MSAAILVLFTTLSFGQLAYAKKTVKISEPSTAVVKEQEEATTPDMADLFPKTAELSKRLTDLEKSLDEVFDPSAAENSFRDTEKKLSDFSRQLEDLKTTKTTGYYQLMQLKTALQLERDSLKKNIEPLTENLMKVSALNSEWLKEKKQWSKWQASLDEDMQFRAVQSTFARAQKTISKAHTMISQHLEPLLAAETKGNDLQTRTYSIISEVNDLISDRPKRKDLK